MSPPRCPSTMTDEEIADVLQMMVEHGDLFDGQTIWLAEATSRLRRRSSPTS